MASSPTASIVFIDGNLEDIDALIAGRELGATHRQRAALANNKLLTLTSGSYQDGISFTAAA